MASSLWHTSFPQGPGLFRAPEGLSDSPGAISRGGTPGAATGAQPSCTQDSPSPQAPPGLAASQVGWGTGVERGPPGPGGLLTGAVPWGVNQPGRSQPCRSWNTQPRASSSWVGVGKKHPSGRARLPPGRAASDPQGAEGKEVWWWDPGPHAYPRTPPQLPLPHSKSPSLLRDLLLGTELHPQVPMLKP